VKTILFVLLTSCVGVLAQTSDTNNADSRYDVLRRKVRETLAAETNANNASSATATPTANAPTAPGTNAAATLAQSTFPTAPSATPRRVPPRRIPPLTNNPPATNLVSTNAAVPAGTAGPVPPGIPTTPATPTPAPTPTPTPAEAAAVAATASLLQTTNAVAAKPAEPIIPAGEINFPAVDVNQVLQIYGDLVGRTILRPTALPAQLITLKTQTPLTKSEAIDALNSVLALNGITMINVGDKFVKALPQAQALQDTPPFSTVDPNQLPEMGTFVSKIVQLKYIKPSEIMPALTPFAKMPGGLVPIENNQTIFIRDYSENVKRMMEVIAKLDVEVPMDYETAVIPIKYALAADISSALGSLGGGGSTGGTSIGRRPGSNLAGSGATPGGYSTGTLGGTTGTSPFGTTPGTTGTSPFGGGAFGGGNRTTSFTDRLQQIVRKASASGEFQILGNNKIIADERTNSLLVFASKQDMEVIKDIVSKLDVVLAQVLIEAVIMEVTLDDSVNVGVSYLQKDLSRAGDFNGIGAIKNGTFLDKQNFIGLGTNAANGALPSGFSYVASFNDDFSATITAAANDNRINVLSRPRIQTSHAVQANLQIGDTVPYVTGTYFGGINGQASSQYQQTFVGINLQVTPLINPDGLVVMDIMQDVQQLGTPTIIDGNPVPTTTKRTASAKVSVKDRDTIILGGFISSTKSSAKSGVPLLMDIPVLGWLFRSTGNSTKRTELIVLIRPTVLPTPEAAALVATRERDRLPGVKAAEVEFRKDEAKRLKKAENLKVPTDE
jgi:general secretion pathway protein D